MLIQYKHSEFRLLHYTGLEIHSLGLNFHVIYNTRSSMISPKAQFRIILGAQLLVLEMRFEGSYAVVQD